MKGRVGRGFRAKKVDASGEEAYKIKVGDTCRSRGPINCSGVSKLATECGRSRGLDNGEDGKSRKAFSVVKVTRSARV